MKKVAIIWRESAYNNGFKCNKCGKGLSEGGDVATPDYCLVDEEELSELEKGNLEKDARVPFFCPHCHSCVAYARLVDAPKELTGMQGNFVDFLKNKA